MPDRLRARAVLVALLVLLTVAGIRAVGPAVGLELPARGVVIAVGCALEAVLAGLLVALRWRRGSVGSGTGAGTGSAGTVAAGTDIGARLRPLLSGVLATGLVAIPLAILVSSLARVPARRPVPPALRQPRLRHSTIAPLARTARGAASLAFIGYGLFALLLIALIATAVVIWRHRRPRAERLDDVTEDDAATPAELARAVDEGRAALREVDDARAAIIRCYLAMEHSLADAGAARGTAETPDELLARAVADGLISARQTSASQTSASQTSASQTSTGRTKADPASELTGLFYEARFSTHAMPPSRRDLAERALAELAAVLLARAEPAGAEPA